MKKLFKLLIVHCSLLIAVCSLFIVNHSSAQTYTISGYVKYHNKDSTAMTNTTVYLANSGDTIIAITTTDATGYYIFVNLVNRTYKLSCITTIPWGGVNPADALIISRFYVRWNIGIYKLTDPLIKLAADVNNDKKINLLDANMIFQRFLGIIHKFNIPDWLFSDPNVTVNGKNITKNIIAICAGDVNSSYIP